MKNFDKKYTVTIDFGWFLKPFSKIGVLIERYRNGNPKPLPCPICGNTPWLRFDEDVRCSKCSIMIKNKPHSPAIWHDHNEKAGIRAWNTWVRQFDKNDCKTWVDEVCLNYFSWYDMGYSDSSMTKNNSTYEWDSNGECGYRNSYDRRRMFLNVPTDPHVFEDESICRIFGKNSLKYKNIGFFQRLKEMF